MSSADIEQLAEKINEIATAFETISTDHKQLIGDHKLLKRRMNRLDTTTILPETDSDGRFRVNLERVKNAEYYTVSRINEGYDNETGQWMYQRTAKIEWNYVDDDPTKGLDLNQKGVPKYNVGSPGIDYPTIERNDDDFYFKDGEVKKVRDWGKSTLPARLQPVYSWRTADGADIMYASDHGRVITPFNSPLTADQKITAKYATVGEPHEDTELGKASDDKTLTYKDVTMTVVIDTSHDQLEKQHWYQLKLNDLKADERTFLIEMMNALAYDGYFVHIGTGQLYTAVYKKDGDSIAPFISEDAEETVVLCQIAYTETEFSLKDCTAVPFGDQVIDEYEVIPRDGVVFASTNEFDNPVPLASIVDSINDGNLYSVMDATEDTENPLKLTTESPLTMHLTTGPSKIEVEIQGNTVEAAMTHGQGIVFGVNNPSEPGWINYGGSLGNLNATTLETTSPTSPGFQYALKIDGKWVVDKLPSEEDQQPTRDYRIFYFIDKDYAAELFGKRADSRTQFLVYSSVPKDLCVECPAPE